MDTIGPYKILQTLVAGRRPLYLATAKDGSRVAIKTAPLEGLSEEEKARFQREAAVCAQLDPASRTITPFTIAYSIPSAMRCGS